MSLTSVTLGNFFTTSEGKTVLGGAGGSGLDTQALVKTLVDAKSAPITQDQDKIKLNDSQSAALTQLQSLLSAFQGATDALRNPPGVGNEANNVFDFTTGSVGNGGSSYVSVTTTPGAKLQTYNIKDISSIASAASQGTGTFNIASADADATVGAVRFGAGTIHFNGGDVTVDSGDSLNLIAAKFNAVSDTTGVTASVIQIDSTHYTLSFVATKTGTNANFDLTTATGDAAVLANVGVTAAVAGTNAVFKLNGISITRHSNNINDVVSGLTFNILAETPDAVTNYPVTIQPDTVTIQNSIVNFVKTYNALKVFATQQNQLNSDGTYASTAVLANNQTFRDTMDNINANIIAEVAGISGSNPTSLADVGISFTNQPATSTTPQVNNILTVNDGALTSALASNFQGVKNLFGFNLTADNPNLAVFSHTNALGVSSFTLNINPGTSTFTATYDLGNGPVTVNVTAEAISGGTGYALSGQSGTALEGLQLIYASNATSTIAVTATQGIADLSFNSTDAATKASTGILVLALQALKTSDSTLNDDITRLQAQVNTYQQQLLKQFGALEQAISRTNTLLQSLAANQNAALTQSGH